MSLVPSTGSPRPGVRERRPRAQRFLPGASFCATTKEGSQAARLGGEQPGKCSEGSKIDSTGPGLSFEGRRAGKGRRMGRL